MSYKLSDTEMHKQMRKRSNLIYNNTQSINRDD